MIRRGLHLTRIDKQKQHTSQNDRRSIDEKDIDQKENSHIYNFKVRATVLAHTTRRAALPQPSWLGGGLWRFVIGILESASITGEVRVCA